MAKAVEVKLNLSGVKAVLNDPDVIAECVRRCDSIASAANASAPPHGYVSSEPFAAEQGTTSKGNKCGVVYTRTNLGKAMQAKHNTLTKAMDAGRR